MRQNERVEFDVYVNKVINGVPHLARARDLSTAGMFLYALLEPQRGQPDQLAIEFELPGTDRIIWADAEVVHRNANDVGLRFLHLSPRDRRAIDEWMQSA